MDSEIDKHQNESYWTLVFSSNDTTGTIPTLTNVHLFVVFHYSLYPDKSGNCCMEHAYDTSGKLIAYRFCQWWTSKWTSWKKT